MDAIKEAKVRETNSIGQENKGQEVRRLQRVLIYHYKSKAGLTKPCLGCLETFLTG